MKPLAIPADGFKGMGECMAVIEYGPQPRLFTLILLYDACLDLTALRNDMA